MLNPTKIYSARMPEVRRTKDGKIDMSQFSKDDMEQMRRTMLRVDAILAKVKKRLKEA
jgi:hypothetical protein